MPVNKARVGMPPAGVSAVKTSTPSGPGVSEHDGRANTHTETTDGSDRERNAGWNGPGYTVEQP